MDRHTGKDDQEMQALVFTRRSLRLQILAALYAALPNRKHWKRALMDQLGAPDDESGLALWILEDAGFIAADPLHIRITPKGCLEFERQAIAENP